MIDPDDYLTYLLTNLTRGTRIVRRNWLETRERSRLTMRTEKRYHVEFREGDIVMLWRPRPVRGLTKRFITFWDGPYRIVRQTGAYNYLIQMGRDKPFTANVSHLLRYDLLSLTQSDGVARAAQPGQDGGIKEL